jgi:cytochrome c5
MKRSTWSVLAMLAVWPHAVLAQQGAGNVPLNDKQLLGMRLFNQSCRVCHTKPQLTSPLYGRRCRGNRSAGRTA